MYIYVFKYENDIFFFMPCEKKKHLKKSSNVEKVTHTAKKRFHRKQYIDAYE